MNESSPITRQDLVMAYKKSGSFRKGAHLLNISREEFGKLWWERVDIDPLIIKPGHIEMSAYKFGVISDTHLGHRAQQLTHLRNFYKLCKDRGCKCVLHAGDLTDGMSLDGCNAEQFLFSPDDVINYVVDNYPNDLPTHFISGNHDEKFIKNLNINVCAEIADARTDMNFLGSSYAPLVLGEIKFFLAHGMGSGTASSRLEFVYKMAARSIVNPDVVINGHVHAWNITPHYNGSFLLQTPCFLGQNDSMKAAKIFPAIGGAILYVNENGERSIDCIPYREMKNDF